MDIGPIRRRFTAEPVVSPVPADAPAREPAASERAVPGQPAAGREHDVVAPTHA